MEKLIIAACICGAEVTKEHNPAVPYTVEEIVREAKSAYDAGASVIHLHVREDDGTPTQSHERFQECMDAIYEVCPDVIIQPSTGGAVGMTDEERLDSTNVTPTPEFVTLDCGTCNFGGDEIFVNTDNTIINFAKTMQEKGMKPELECFDKGMLDIVLKTAGRKGYLDMHLDRMRHRKRCVQDRCGFHHYGWTLQNRFRRQPLHGKGRSCKEQWRNGC